MQFGFRKYHSTDTATCYFLENVKQLLDKGGFVGAVFLDLQRAFDTINHDVLLAKLSYFNFSNSALCWMKSYLHDRKQAVQIENSQSSFLSCSDGVPQGSVLGPLLFSLYVNNLPDVCKKTKIQLYADDTVLYAHAKTKAEAAAVLSGAMVPVFQWLQRSCLHLNTQKTVCMFFSRQPTREEQPSVVVNGEQLEVVEQFKYLGIIFDSKLTFKDHVKKISNIVKFNLSNFKQIRSSLTTEAAKVYMHSLIFSHITYRLTTWSQTNESTLKPLKSLFKRTLKVLDKKPLRYHYCDILTKYGIMDFESYKMCMDACLIFKVLNGLAPPPLLDFLSKKINVGIGTRALTRGDCNVQRRRTKFSQTVVSIRGTQLWNTLPQHIRNWENYPTFQTALKQWLKTNQSCRH
uniref:Reverse transcriptase domain-containing protein n=1 Tax=Oryzias latipes TaxID=8090 RepID=A0A3P9IXE9_ORYLA